MEELKDELCEVRQSEEEARLQQRLAYEQYDGIQRELVQVETQKLQNEQIMVEQRRAQKS